ncbi:TadE-like protein [Roseimaritima multifibrata]|uniref:TadE-like protein n=1 Tax=Roseimaritima multifibrata TaxID=1930274 RepID=A0A517MBR0_9BACT|nr:TadE family protein [Roseimaritima multifibrata]QDS92320.1 TadE-like protein [Roseimaritima multifibrata]
MRRRKNHNRPIRRALATAELAICLPIVLAICVATIDLCSAMFLKESLTIAAYEGSRLGIMKGGTNARATARVRELLDERNITYDAGSVVTFSDTDFDTADTMEHITLTVEAPAAGNLISATQYFNNRTIQAQVVMRKEYANPSN